MPPQQTPGSQVNNLSRGLWLASSLLAVLILVIGVLVGVQLAHGNSDYVCAHAVNDTQQGSCTNGSWSPWTTVSGVLQRTYTGTQSTVSFAGRYLDSCSHPGGVGVGSASGQITTEYAACQIAETGTGGTGGGGTGGGAGSGATSTITVTSQNVTTGAVSTSTQASGSWADYQNTIDAQLATGTISVAPSILRSGTTTHVAWTSDHVKTCTVVGTNGDSWPKAVTTTQTVTDADGNQQDVQTTSMPDGKTGNEVSLPIVQQTTYTLNCVTAIGTHLVSQATVTILPIFQEQ